MTDNRDDISIEQFAKKNVISLPKEASIGEAIRLMFQNQIRHIPIVNNGKIIGVVNTKCIIDLVGQDVHQIDFNDNVGDIAIPNFHVVNPGFPLFKAVEIISEDPQSVILLEESDTLIGIYTEIDILDTDFLWLYISDTPITTEGKLGRKINLDGTSSVDQTIHNTIKMMKHLDQEYITLSESNDYVLGLVDFFDIIHFIYYSNNQKGERLQDILSQSMYSIFPSAGAWYYEPIMLSRVRREMYIHDIYYGIIMDDNNEAKLLISTRDIISYLVKNSDYFD